MTNMYVYNIVHTYITYMYIQDAASVRSSDLMQVKLGHQIQYLFVSFNLYLIVKF